MTVVFGCRCGTELRAAFFEEDETDIVQCRDCERAYVVSRPVVVDIDEVHEHVHDDN